MTLQTTAAKASAALVLVLTVAGGSFIAGWKVNGWKNDSEQAAIERAAQAITAKAMARESGIAEKVEQRLGELKANQTVIDRGIIREVQKPVYRNVCFPDGALIGLLNAAARGEAPRYSAGPAGEVSGPAEPAQ